MMGADFRDYPVSMISTKIGHQKMKTRNVRIEVVSFVVGDVVFCLTNIQWTETRDLDFIFFTQKKQKRIKSPKTSRSYLPGCL